MIGEQNPSEKQSKLSQILLLGMEEVMGEGALNGLLVQCDLPGLKTGLSPHQLDNPLHDDDYRKLLAALRSQYGPLSARGLALRSGRESFKYGLREYGQQTGLLDMKFRLLPTRDKLRSGLYSLSNLVGKTGSYQAHIEESEQYYLWRMDPTWPLCWKEPHGAVTCPTLTGLLQEFLYWASGGKRFKIVDGVNSDSGLISLQSGASCDLWIDKLAFE